MGGIEPDLAGFTIEEVDDLVGYAVAYLIGMPLGNRFTREDVVLARHRNSPA
jgi:hypothetical protein